MKTRRNTGGFTLLEVMLAVALIGILSAVAAVNVAHYQRALTQVELDGIAREIFVAAQNHLTMAESQGFMGIDPNSDSDWGNEYQKRTPTEPAIYYYVTDPQTDRTPLNMLNLMLPFASVDETVRKTGGSYVIRYQTDPALVLDVFYAVAEKNEKGETINRKFTYTFTEDEAKPPTEGRPLEATLWYYSGSDQREARGKYPTATGTDVIGWYGVDPEWFSVQSGGERPIPVSKGAPLLPPTVKIVNAEQLYVEVTNPNVDYENQNTFKYAKLNLEITGADGKRKWSIPLISSGDTGQPVPNNHYIQSLGDGIHPSSFRVILDDVTQENTRFCKIMKDAELYPGENIIIRAVSYNNTELTNIATSANAETNSLFAAVNSSAADIANFRHLENLDSNISHVASTEITNAKQTSDMDWTTFCRNIKDLRGLSDSDKINVSTDSDIKSNKGDCYLPVTNAGTITYNGENHTIKNVEIDVPGDAGLFATLGDSSTVTNLKLFNFSVTSSGGNAGALAGVLDNSSVQSVLVHHDIDKSGDGYKVTGKDAAGGLVGLVNGTCAIEQSAAAVYVTSNSGDAGGLIGTVSGGASATVMNSYAGGHTENGHYDKDNCNVTADNGNAGGLIGRSAVTSTANLIVKNCYATTSVDGKTAAGGLIGAVAGGTITNCYVTGYVQPDSTAGAFAGKASDSTTRFTNDRYLSIINGKLPNVGNIEEHPNVSAFDDSLEHYYRDYTPCTSGAVPYDPTLTQYYGGKYLFKTISQLNDSGTYTAEWMTKHYGDWPMPETQVINVKSGGA